MNKHNLTIEFDTKKQREEFASWLCEQGEQDYFTWMEERPDHAVTAFHYHGQETKGKFIADGIIRTTTDFDNDE